jgi:hypothetical protein
MLFHRLTQIELSSYLIFFEKKCAEFIDIKMFDSMGLEPNVYDRIRTLLYPIMLLAGIGLALSISAHCAALLGFSLPENVWLLHVGIFVVWFPAVLVAARMTRGGKQKDFWKNALAGCQKWMRNALYVLIGYSVLNFVWFILRSGNSDSQSSQVRGFSGHWMIFYAIGFMVLYSARHSPYFLRTRTCSAGHEVSPGDEYCPRCGRPLISELERAN